jgi:heat shock protein HslJ
MKRCLILMLPLALAACAKTPQGEPATPPAAVAPAATQTAPTDTTALSAYHWRLNDAKDTSGKRIDALFVNADKPLQLDFAGERISVSNTCNHMGGAYSVEGDKLKFDRLASTLMACTDPKLMALDQEIGKRLETESTFALQPGDAPTLTLIGGNGDVLTFKGDPTAETRYGGPGETAFLEVAAQTKPCSHPLIPNKQCLQVREVKYDDKGIKAGTDGEFQNSYSDIEGYNHEPGIRNVVRVKRYAIKNPPADGSSLTYVLDMVVESETVKP